MPTLQTPKPDIAKVFMSGNSQAVRLPKEYRFDVDTLTIQKIGDSVVLTPTLPLSDVWDDFQQALNDFDLDFAVQFGDRDKENQMNDLLETNKNMALANLFD